MKRKGRASSSSSIRVHVRSSPFFEGGGGLQFISSSRSCRRQLHGYSASKASLHDPGGGTVRKQFQDTVRDQFENSRRVGHGEKGEGNEFEFRSSSRSLEFGFSSKFNFFKAGGVEFTSSPSSV